MTNRSDLLAQLAALASEHRLSIIGALADGPLHVSDLARRIGVSRALLYMHVSRLEEVGFVRGELRVTDEGRVHKYYENLDFSIDVSVATILAAQKTKTEEKI